MNGTTLITVDCAGAVTISLWDPIPPTTCPPNSIPGPSVGANLTIVDIGGHALAHPITINPAATRTIMGLTTVSIDNDYASQALRPNLTTGDWDQA